SPTTACTSPARSSMETSSFATTPGKRFVTPRITTRGGVLTLPAPRRPPCEKPLRSSGPLRARRGHDVAVQDLLFVLLHRVDDVRRHQRGIGRGVRDAGGREVEDL